MADDNSPLVSFEPVDHDPFAMPVRRYTPTPTYMGGQPSGPATGGPFQAYSADDVARVVGALGQFAGDLARPFVSLATAPHDALYGGDTPGAIYGTSSPSIDQRGIEGGLLLAGGPAASVEEGAAEATAASKLLESRNARIYNPPDVGPRPFSDDYSGISGNGPLRTDIEGRPLGAAFIAGRRTVGGADEALSPAQLDAGIQGTLGAPPEAVAQGALPRRAVGAYRVVRGPDGPERSIVVSQNLSAPAKDMVAAHEFGHAIDDLAGGINATQGMRAELGKVYNDLNNPSMSPDVGKPWSPQAFGYKGSDADRELIAEAIRAYAVNPNYLKSVAPNTASAIRAAVNANPRLSQTIQFNAGSKPLAALGDAAEAGEEGALGSAGGKLTQPPSAAAIRLNGQVYAGKTHSHAVAEAARQGVDFDAPGALDFEPGYIADNGFIPDTEAKKQGIHSSDALPVNISAEDQAAHARSQDTLNGALSDLLGSAGALQNQGAPAVGLGGNAVARGAAQTAGQPLVTFHPVDYDPFSMGNST